MVARGTCWLLVNPVEYHGPHLSLENDHLCSLGLARELARRQPGPHVLIGELGVGVDPAAGPGSRHTPYRVVVAAVMEACRSLVELGARRVVLLTFHGAPLHNRALYEGARFLLRQGLQAAAPFALLTDELVSMDTTGLDAAFDTIEDPNDRERARAGMPLDFHAGFFETSVALHLAPDSVDAGFREVPDCPAWPAIGWLQAAARWVPGRLGEELAAVARIAGWTQLRPYPGYTGCPRLASGEAGNVFVSAIVHAFEAELTRSFEAAPHVPMMAWLRWLTLGGRLTPPPVPLDAFAKLS